MIDSKSIIFLSFLGINQYSPFSFSNPVYEPGAPSGNPPGSAGPTYKVEDVVVMRGTYGTQASKPWPEIKSTIFIYSKYFSSKISNNIIKLFKRVYLQDLKWQK